MSPQRLILLCAALLLSHGCGVTTSVQYYRLFNAEDMLLQRLDGDVNLPGDNYAPSITPDGRTLYFNNMGDDADADVYVAGKSLPQIVEFNAPAIRVTGLDTPYSEGNLVFSADGSMVMCVSCRLEKGPDDCDLYEVTQIDREGVEMVSLRDLNSSRWESAPTLSSDGRLVCFISNRNDGRDIYQAERDASGKWSKPTRIGWPISSTSKEDSPWIAFNDSALFFASDRPGGFGGFDLYISFLNPDGSWGSPMNLGPQFNTAADDRYISISRDGKVVYFASNREGGRYGIYMATGSPVDPKTVRNRRPW